MSFSYGSLPRGLFTFTHCVDFRAFSRKKSTCDMRQYMRASMVTDIKNKLLVPMLPVMD